MLDKHAYAQQPCEEEQTVCKNDRTFDAFVKTRAYCSVKLDSFLHCKINGELNYFVPSRQLTKFGNFYTFTVRRNKNLAGSTFVATD